MPSEVISEEERQRILGTVQEVYYKACARERYYLFPEAFCLMSYKDKVTGDTERIWNARNGVSPFTTTSKHGNEAMHVEWGKDTRSPEHSPSVGSRVFVDYDPERALGDAIAMVSEGWNAKKYPLSDNFASQAHAVEHFAVESYRSGVPPVLVEVDEDLRRARSWR